ncbi:hypothetical protein [Wenxinia saemankumensis]|uniref:Glycosyltransferase involved in LPS biosynthesis, GR25 family n=1 Tax=Wenxinia saemankumensis TaxID=1447782 RepID=A0A1M6ETL1_9RHOB|nr:hypothetical protein [Wenxinia saemankumensis]SHI88834.1 hypothetical protein SAMN05444417_2169 [Wenxinia saemankumensis]
MAGGDGIGARLLEALGPAYVINLPQRADRRRGLEAELRRVGLSLSHPGVRLVAAIRPADPGPFTAIGIRGCFESHLAVLRLIAESAAPSGLIVEDDMGFHRAAEARLGTLLPGLGRTGWDIFYGYLDGTNRPEGVAAGLARIAPGDHVRRTHFMAVRREAAQTILPYLEAIAARPAGHPQGGAMHVDGAYSWCREAHPGLRTLAARPDIAVQRPSRSDIAAQPWFDRVPGLAVAVDLARGWKHRLRG